MSGSLKVRLAVLTAALSAALVAPAQATFPGGNGKIAFVRDGAIHTMNVDGTGVTRLTSDASREGEPKWSPDGSRIAFARGDDIWVMNADGSNPVNLTNSINREF